MALTRKMLKAMGIEEDKIEQIIEAHGETVSALKDERDGYKADAEKLDEVQRELDRVKKAAKDGGEDTVPKSDYEKLQNDFDTFKSNVDAEKTRTAKQTAYRELLRAVGVSDKRIDSILRVTDMESVELDKDGKIKDADKLTEAVKSEWADFIELDTTKGANVAKPPASGGGAFLSKEEIYKMENGRYVLSPSERQEALARLYQHEEGK